MEVPQGKHAWMVKIGEKGQFVIPKEARDIFGFHPGDELLAAAKGPVHQSYLRLSDLKSYRLATSGLISSIYSCFYFPSIIPKTLGRLT